MCTRDMTESGAAFSEALPTARSAAMRWYPEELFIKANVQSTGSSAAITWGNAFQIAVPELG